MSVFEKLFHPVLRMPNPMRVSAGLIRDQLAQHRQMSDKSCVPDEDVLFSTAGGKGLIVLNRPKQLNALNQSMVRKIYPVLQKWANEKNLIVVKGSGDKSFCAGGDVVAIARGTADKAKSFFYDEYKLDGMVASLKIPYVALLNGIVMGGGVGISIHGKYRVATEKSLFAMPETLIGLFPDVGVTHFLSRMPHNLGLFLALTGYRLKGYDLYHTGIATHYCSTEKLGLLEKTLLNPGESQNCQKVEDILNDMHCQSISLLPKETPPPFSLESHLDTISHCFAGETVEKIVTKLQQNNSGFAKEMHGLLEKMSPTSMKITLKQIKNALCLNVYECLNTDYRIASHVVEEKEFYEGVRAQLITKDKRPNWYPDQLSKISEEKMDSYFAALDPSKELNLPFSLQDPCCPP